MKRLFLFGALVSVLTAWADTVAPEPAQYFLYASPTARQHWAASGVSLKAQVNQWRDLLRARQVRYEIITRPQRLQQLPQRGTLIVPSAIALSPAERAIIQERLQKGDHLLATGALDLPDRAALLAPNGPTPATDAMPDPLPDSNYIVTAANTPLTYTLAAGTRLWVDSKTLAPLPALPYAADAYQTTWGRVGSRGLLAHATVGASRRALLAWPESTWSQDNNSAFQTIAGLALDWVSDHPVAYVASWPWPHRAALSIGVDATWRFDNLNAIAALLARGPHQASFHFLASDLGQQVKLIHKLRQQGHQVGALGDQWQVFAGQSAATQTQRIDQTRRSFAAQGIQLDEAGLRPPEGRTDAATEEAANGLAYLVDAGRIDTLVPVSTTPAHPVLLSNALNLDGAAPTDAIFTTLSQLAAHVSRLGGYTYVGIDAAQAMPNGALLTALARFLATEAAQQHLWIASAAHVAQWSRAVQRVSVAPSQMQDQHLDLTVQVGAGAPLPEGMALTVYAPAGRTIRAVHGAADVRLVPQTLPDGGTVVLIAGLPAGEHRLRLELAP